MKYKREIFSQIMLFQSLLAQMEKTKQPHNNGEVN